MPPRPAAAFSRPALAALPDEDLLEALLPRLALVEHEGSIDDPERALGDRRLEFLARRHEVAVGENLLCVAEQEIEEQDRGVRMLSSLDPPDPVRAGDSRWNDEQVE